MKSRYPVNVRLRCPLKIHIDFDSESTRLVAPPELDGFAGLAACLSDNAFDVLRANTALICLQHTNWPPKGIFHGGISIQFNGPRSVPIIYSRPMLNHSGSIRNFALN